MKTRLFGFLAAAFAVATFTLAGSAFATPSTSSADDTFETTACGSCGCAKKADPAGKCDGTCKKGGECAKKDGECAKKHGGCDKCDGGCDKCDGGCDKCDGAKKDGGCDKCDGAKAAKAPMSFDAAPAVGTKATCPVMGGEFTVTDKTQRSEYDGKHYVFCCPGCKPKFDKDPAKYVVK